MCFRVVCLTSALVLGACGGGGGGSPASTEPAPEVGPPQGKAAELLGNWRACTPLDDAGSREDKYTFTADSARDLAYEYTHALYPSADCTGGETGHYTQSGVLHIDEGVKEFSGTQALMVNFWPESFSTGGSISFSGDPTGGYAQLLSINSDGLLLEGATEDLDELGYPTSLAGFEYYKLP